MFFLDEIQKVEDFEKGINSLRITNNYSIFITGSNSRMTFLELSTDLSGRYVSFRVNPLSFKEIVELTNTKEKDYKVFIGKTKKGKIDFVASKNGQFKYIQVCFNVSDDNTRLREFSAFDEIVEGEKYIITLTEEDYSENGIKQINLFDFLMNDNF